MNATEKNWLLLVAYLNLEQQRPGDACTILRVLSKIDPGNLEVERCHALAELSAGRPEVAARIATRAMQQEKSAAFKIPVGLVFAKALWEQGKHEAARDYIANLLAETASKMGKDKADV